MRGQVTVFMIVGLVVILVAGTVFLALDRFKFKPDVPLEEKSRISRLAASCIEQLGDTGARVIAAQGGYIQPALYESADGINIAYGYYGNDITLATVTEMEQDLGDYIDSMAADCIRAGLPRAEVAEPKTNVIIGDNLIMVETHCRVELDSEYEDVFKTEVRLPLGRMHTLATEAVQHIDPDWLDLSSLSLMPVHINLVPHGESILYYMLDNSGLMFNFAAQYIENKPPQLHLPDMLKAKDGMPWMYKVNCTDPEGDSVTISDSTIMIDTLPDGSILSTMEVPGNYPITFRCEDTHDNIDEKTVLMIVE